MMIDIPDDILSDKLKKDLEESTAEEYAVDLYQQEIFVTIDNKNRHGKTMTILHNVPVDKQEAKQMTKDLKKAMGVGGTFVEEEGKIQIEVQGDQREKIQQWAAKKKLKLRFK